MLSKILKKKKKNEQPEESNENNSTVSKTPDDIEWDPEAVKRTAQVGLGDFGMIFKGECYCDSVLHRVFVSELRLKSGFESEVALFASLQHPFILPVLGFYEDTFYRRKYVLSQYVEKETLDEYLRGYQQHRKDYADTHHNRKLTSWAIDIATALKYLHSKKVIHGNLAAHNIFMILAPDCSIKLTDYGLWKIAEPASVRPRTLKWASAEVREESYYSTMSDVYSFGVVLWQIFSWGAEPYGDVDMNSANAKSLFKNPLPQPTECPEEIYKLMLDCWKTDPEERPYSEQIIDRLTKIQKDMKNALRPDQGNLLPGLVALKMTLPKQLGAETDFSQLGWYGRIGRVEAEKQLQKTPVGTYLIRWSENENSYVLSSRQSDGFSHISGLTATDDSFLVSTPNGQLHFDKAIHYLQFMKNNSTGGIISSIHEIATPQMRRSTSFGIYVNEDNNTGLYVNNASRRTNSISRSASAEPTNTTHYEPVKGQNNAQDEYPSVYVIE